MRKSIGTVPFTVATVALVSWVLVTSGVNEYPGGFSSLPFLLDPLYYVGSLFVHSGMSHYVANMLFFVPAGLALTYLAGDKRVVAVVVAAHVPTAVVAVYIGEGAGVVGATAAAYGLLAAVLVRSVWVGTEIYDPMVRVVSAVGVFAFAGLALLLATGGAITVQYAPVVGFVFGGALETRYVLTKFANRMPNQSNVPSDYVFEGPSFRTRWQNMADDEEEAKEMERRYSGTKASPDDTRSGSGGRRRDG